MAWISIRKNLLCYSFHISSHSILFGLLRFFSLLAKPPFIVSLISHDTCTEALVTVALLSIKVAFILSIMSVTEATVQGRLISDLSCAVFRYNKGSPRLHPRSFP